MEHTPTEPSVINNFDEISVRQSTQIYRLFTLGKVLNKQYYDDVHGCFVDDQLFTLVFNKISHFTQFFKHMGYELRFDEDGDFYYTQESREHNTEESDDNAMKIQAILLFIGRYYAKVGDLSQLADPMFGLKEADIDALKNDDLLQSSLKALRLDNWDKALDYLTTRSLLFKMGKNSYVFSSAAMAFLQRLIAAHTEYINR